MIRFQIDECTDANGAATIRLYGSSPNGDTGHQPIATVYDWGAAPMMAAAPRMLAALRAVAGVPMAAPWLAAAGVAQLVQNAIAEATGAPTGEAIEED